MAIQKIGQDELLKKKGSCRNCGAILEYYEQDVEEKSYTDYSGCSDTDRFIICCECKKRVIVK